MVFVFSLCPLFSLVLSHIVDDDTMMLLMMITKDAMTIIANRKRKLNCFPLLRLSINASS